MDSRNIPTPEEARAELKRRALVEKYGDDLPTPEEAREELKKRQRFEYFVGNNSPVGDLGNIAAGIISGLGKGGQYIATKLTGGYAPTVDFDKMTDFLRPKKKTATGDLIHGIASYVPTAIAAGPAILPQLPGGALYGASQYKPGQKNLFGLLPEGEGGAAAAGALANLIPFVVGRAANALRPSRLLRGNLEPHELERNLRITQGTETGLGDVIGSPFLKKRLENTLTGMPFSGANESLGRTAREVEQRGVNILQDLLGNNDPHNIPQIISEDLNNEFERHETTKNQLYDRANQIANESNLRLELPTFARHANEFRDAIDTTNMLKYEPDIAKIFNKLRNYINPVSESRNVGNIIDKQGKPIIDETVQQFPTLQEANLLKGKLNQYANMASRSPEPEKRNMARVFGKLANSLRNDIRNTISASGNRELESAYNTAERNYDRNFSQFLDKDIYKYIGGNANEENIVRDFIKTTPNADLAHQITKISEKLMPPTRQLLTYSYLSRALDNEGHINPTIMGTLINKLKPNQFRALVPDSTLRERLRDYSTLQHMNKEAQNLMFNPKTGQRGIDTAMTLALGIAGKLATGNIGALAAPLATIVAGRVATYALTSQSLRRALVEEMLRNRTRFGTSSKLAQILGQGMPNASAEGE